MFLPWYSHAGPTGRGTIIAILPEPTPCQADDNTGQLLAPARPEQNHGLIRLIRFVSQLSTHLYKKICKKILFNTSK